MSNKLLQALNTNVSEVGARKNFASITAAIAVAYSLKLVSDASDVPNPYSYFDNVLEAQAKTLLLEINETVVISVKDTLELTRKIWVQRFNLVFNPISVNPALLVAQAGNYDTGSLGAEFLEYSKVYNTGSSAFANELLVFIQEVNVKYTAQTQQVAG